MINNCLFPNVKESIPFNLKQSIPLEMNIIVTDKNNKPMIELRKSTYDPELMKAIIKAAFHDQPILILPTFSNKIFSLGSLVDKGILYIDPEDGKYYFTN